MAFTEIASHKLRSILSISGVLLGVASLVAMLTLIGGIDKFLNQKMSKWAGSIWYWQKGSSDAADKLAFARSPGLRFSDGDYLVENSTLVKGVKKEISREGTMTVGRASEWGRLRGLTENIFNEDTVNIQLASGRYLDATDYRVSARVCVCSWEMAQRLCAQISNLDIPSDSIHRDQYNVVLGKDLVFRGVSYEIVGIYEPKDPDFKPWNLRRVAAIPLKTMQETISGIDPNPGAIEVTIANVKRAKEDAEKVAKVLALRHRGVEDFEYRSAEWIENMKSMLGNIGLLMGIISVISLLVGGLSIMNVMLSSISERIHEIGIRKALGANTMQIFVQFIAETTTLSCLGGVCGVVVGLIPLAFGEALKKASDGAIEPTILPVHIMYVVFVIMFVGVLFGLYPALRASRMNPVDALRYE